MKKNQTSIDQSIGDWMADEGYSPSKQQELIHLVQRSNGKLIQLTDMLTNELKELIQETLDSVESEEYSLWDLTGMNQD